MNPKLLSLLCSPHDQSRLEQVGNELVSVTGHRYPLIEGVPVLLRDDVPHTIWVAAESLKYARMPNYADPYFIATIGLTDIERAQVERDIRLWEAEGKRGIDPVASQLVAATSGYLYKQLQGYLTNYPIPEFRLGPGDGKQLLDVGCNWGRWIIASGKLGYRPIGIDPSLGAVLAAKRICQHFGIEAEFVVGDGRYLPFQPHVFDTVFSYSVIQHFSKTDARQTLQQISRVLKPFGESFIQMPNRFGVRSAYHLVRRRFSEGEAFDVRYYTPRELEQIFREIIGPSQLSVDGYFGLGIQKSDYHLMSLSHKVVITASEVLRAISQWVGPLRYVADSLYIHSIRNTTSQ